MVIEPIIIILISFISLIVAYQTISFQSQIDVYDSFITFNDKFKISNRFGGHAPIGFYPGYMGFSSCNPDKRHVSKRKSTDVRSTVQIDRNNCFSPQHLGNNNYNYSAEKTRESCTSNKDIFNQPKIPGIWSPPCNKNDDCPFFKKNVNYTNSLGGCILGSCQMPIGVIKIGNRHYSGNPKCHRCSGTDIYDPPSECCEDQKSNLIYPDLISPDYAFVNDSILRNQ